MIRWMVVAPTHGRKPVTSSLPMAGRWKNALGVLAQNGVLRRSCSKQSIKTLAGMSSFYGHVMKRKYGLC